MLHVRREVLHLHFDRVAIVVFAALKLLITILLRDTLQSIIREL